MAYAAGIDVGSTQTKVIVLDEQKRIVGRALLDTGANWNTAADRAFQNALKDGALADEEVEFIVGIGYGHYKVPFSHARATEIKCHARGALHLFPNTRTVLDMGGENIQAIRVQPNGRVADFSVNDECAAGTGRFLQETALTMEIPVSELGSIALNGEEKLPINNKCTVFAQSEMFSWLGNGKKIEDILLGLHHSIGERAVELLQRVGIEQQVTLSGGVSRNCAMVNALNQLLGFSVNVSDESQFMGALGAALIAMDRITASRTPIREGASR